MASSSEKKTYSIELYFNPELESQATAPINVYGKTGTPTEMINTNQRHCITLFSTPSLDPSELRDSLAEFAANHRVIPISFIFHSCPFSDDERTRSCFVHPSQTAALLWLQEDICDLMKNNGIMIPAEYLPGKWDPRCSVCLRMPETERMYSLIDMMLDKTPMDGTATAIGLAEFSEKRNEIYSFSLNSAPSASANAGSRTRV